MPINSTSLSAADIAKLVIPANQHTAIALGKVMYMTESWDYLMGYTGAKAKNSVGDWKALVEKIRTHTFWNSSNNGPLLALDNPAATIANFSPVAMEKIRLDIVKDLMNSVLQHWKTGPVLTDPGVIGVYICHGDQGTGFSVLDVHGPLWKSRVWTPLQATRVGRSSDYTTMKTAAGIINTAFLDIPKLVAAANARNYVLTGVLAKKIVTALAHKSPAETGVDAYLKTYSSGVRSVGETNFVAAANAYKKHWEAIKKFLDTRSKRF